MYAWMGLIASALLVSACGGNVGGSGTATFTLHLQSQVEDPPGSGVWRTTHTEAAEPASQTAIIICDMWDKHWCRSATRRCGAIALRMAPVIESARRKGALIIHAPSECMEFYKDTPQRRLAKNAPKPVPASHVETQTIADPPLPIDDSDGGCDDVPQCAQGKAWTRENPAIRIADGDAISDRGDEILGLLQSRHIQRALIMGVHANMCVLNRSFAIKQLVRSRIPCTLVRDLTDTVYNPRMKPYVPHEAGTALVIGHIEKHWCPSMESADLLR